MSTDHNELNNGKNDAVAPEIAVAVAEAKPGLARRRVARRPALSQLPVNVPEAALPEMPKPEDTAHFQPLVVEDELARGPKQRIKHADLPITEADLRRVNTNAGVRQLLKERNLRLKPVLETLLYEEQLELLQIELVKLQHWVQSNNQRIAILFEGRDAAGKGGTIRRFTEHLNPRALRVVALPKPTEEERGQWYFQRYTRQLPNEGEIVFFDRSWYNRAVVEPVNGFCHEAQYQRFMQQVPEYEHMLYEDGVTIIKFWFSIAQDEQLRRFESRRLNPLKQWKLSPIDMQAQELWNKYTSYKEQMFSKTHTSFSPWIIVSANNKKLARLESIRYVLNQLSYDGKESARTRLAPDPNIVTRFHRGIVKID